MSLIIEILCACFGVLYIVFGLAKYGWWKGISIGGGFMPVVWGSLILIFSIWMIVSKLKKGQESERLDKKALYPLVAMVVILAVNYIFGLVAACIITSFLWLKFVERYSWKMTVLVTIIMGAAVYGIFSSWLNVPFPQGLIGNLL